MAHLRLGALVFAASAALSAQVSVPALDLAGLK